MAAKACQWQAFRQASSANVLTLPQKLRDLAGQAVGWCGRGEPQIADCAAVMALRGARGSEGVVLADRLAGGRRQPTHGAGRVLLLMLQYYYAPAVQFGFEESLRGDLRRAAQKQGSWLLCSFWDRSVIAMPGWR